MRFVKLEPFEAGIAVRKRVCAISARANDAAGTIECQAQAAFASADSARGEGFGQRSLISRSARILIFDSG